MGHCVDVPVTGSMTEYVGLCCIDRDDGDLTADVYQVDPGTDPEEVGCEGWVAVP